jgi:hypothetical protein
MNLRRDICLGTLAALPPVSPLHGLPLAEQLALVKAYGFVGVTAWDNWEAVRDAGLRPCGMGRVLAPEEVRPLARRHQEEGLDFTTLHVGTGFESDDAMARLADAVLDAEAATGHPLHIETHRATMTQDIRRTVDLLAVFPQLSFTLDFSHWYTGHEMTYANSFSERLAWCDPVFARVQSIQLRMGTSGAIQRPLDPRSAHFADHLAALGRCLAVRRASPAPPDVLPVAPELLPARIGEGEEARAISYAEDFETSDRFTEALALVVLAEHRLAGLDQTSARGCPQ